MLLIILQKNIDGSYPPLQRVYNSSPRPGTLIFPEEFYDIFYPSDKRAAGFVNITDDGTTVTSCVWDESAYQAWAAENPEQPEQEPEEPIDTRVADLEEALNMILTGVTE